MKNWEEILKNRLSSYQEKGTPGQEETLWNSIESQIAPATSNSSATGSKLFTNWGSWAIAVVAVFGVTAAAIFYSSEAPLGTKATIETQQVTAISTESVLPSDQITQKANPLLQSPVESEPSTSAIVASTLPTATSTEPEASSETNTPFETRATNIAKKGINLASNAPAPPTNEDNTSTPSTNKNSIEINPSLAKEATSETALDLALAAPSIEPTTSAVEEISAKTPSYPSAPLAVEYAHENTQIIGPETNSESARKLPPMLFLPLVREAPIKPIQGLAIQPDNNSQESEVGMPFALRAYGGPTVSQFAYGDGRESEFNEFFRANFSAGCGLMLEFQKWSQSFAVGIAWNEFIQHLDYTEHSEHAITTEGVLSVQINEITGDTMAVVMGDVEGIERQTRDISHYNRFRAFALPIEWQKQQYFGRWQLGIGLGALIQLRSYAEGRTIGTNGLVSDYSDSNLAQTRLNWMPTGRLYTGFYIAPEWRADFSLSAGLQRFNNGYNGENQENGVPEWRGRMVNGQVQIGITRFFAARIKSE